jgi:putative transcriptional regulator
MSALRLNVLIACAILVLPAMGARAQQDLPANGLLLIAKPSLADPNFSRTVVLVTQTEDGGTVGVIVNRPTTLKLQEFLSDEFDTKNYVDPVYVGGPVMRQALVVLFRSEKQPEAPAFHVLKQVYLTMHPDNIERLLADKVARYRIYAGFAGWAPNQLESEVMRDGWYFLEADEATVLRKNTEGMWEELLERAKKADPRGHS